MMNNSSSVPLKVFMCTIFSLPWMFLRQYGTNNFEFERQLVFYSHFILSTLFITGQITTTAFYMTEFGFIGCVLHNVLERKLFRYLDVN